MKLRLEDEWTRSYALVFGQAVHLALENTFKAAPPDLSIPALETAFDKALLETLPELSTNAALRTVYREHFKRIVQSIPILEKQVQTLFGPTRTVALEEAFDLKLGGLQVRGKIDRIDETKDGRLLVIDYKTGSVDFTPEHMATGDNFQAWAYLKAVSEKHSKPLLGMLFYDLKTPEIRRGILKAEDVTPEAKRAVTRGHCVTQDKMTELLDKGTSLVSSLANKIRAGDFKATPSAEICNYCEFARHCREAESYG